jgi:hypothetical protein
LCRLRLDWEVDWSGGKGDLALGHGPLVKECEVHLLARFGACDQHLQLRWVDEELVVPLEQHIEPFQVAQRGRARGGQLADDEARTGFDAWKLMAQFVGNPVGHHAEKCLNRKVGLGGWRGFGLRRLLWRKDLTCCRPSDAEGGCDDCGEKLGGGIHDEMEVATQGWSHGQSDPWQQVCVIGWGE